MKKQPSGSKSGTDWEARFNCNRQPEVKVLEKSFAGIPAGARMLVVTPLVVDAAVAEIPFGGGPRGGDASPGVGSVSRGRAHVPGHDRDRAAGGGGASVSAHAGWCGISHAVLAGN